MGKRKWYKYKGKSDSKLGMIGLSGLLNHQNNITYIQESMEFNSPDIATTNEIQVYLNNRLLQRAYLHGHQDTHEMNMSAYPLLVQASDMLTIHSNEEIWSYVPPRNMALHNITISNDTTEIDRLHVTVQGYVEEHE